MRCSAPVARILFENKLIRIHPFDPFYPCPAQSG